MKGIFRKIKDEFINAEFKYSDNHKDQSRIIIDNLTIYYNESDAVVIVSKDGYWTAYPTRKTIQSILKDIRNEKKTIHI